MFPLIGGLLALLLIPAVLAGILKLLALSARALLIGLVLLAITSSSDQRLLDRTLSRVTVKLAQADTAALLAIPVRAYSWFQSKCDG